MSKHLPMRYGFLLPCLLLIEWKGRIAQPFGDWLSTGIGKAMISRVIIRCTVKSTGSEARLNTWTRFDQNQPVKNEDPAIVQGDAG